MDNTFTYQGFCGWLTINSGEHTQDPSNQILAMQEALNTTLPIHNSSLKNQAMISTSSIAKLGASGHVSIIGSARWKNSEYRALAENICPAKALVRAYNDYGNDLCQHIHGSYAFVIIDSDNQTFLAGTDRLSRFPLYYHQHDNSIAFGSTPATILAHYGVKKEISKQSIYDYIYFHMVPSPTSIYSGLKKLQAGTLLEISPDRSSLENYWLPAFKETSSKPASELEAELKTTLKASVARSMEGEKAIGAFLSGGLDSSTVVGMMSELVDDQGQAFSIGFSAQGYDEMEYARITAQHFGVHLNEYYVTPEDVVKALPIIATSFDEPFGNSSALPAYFCAKMAKECGVKRLLAGDGGDELFAGNERYAKQNIFENYSKIPDSIRNIIVEPLSSLLSDKIPLASKLKSYIQQAKTPLPDRLQSYNFLHRHTPSEIFNSDFLNKIDTQMPLSWQREIYHRPKTATKLNRMLYLDWQVTLADNDLRKVNSMCALAGVDVAYPMLDDELLLFSTTIPSKLKLKGEKLRQFYKQSLTGWLPDTTIHKKKQGFGLPFGIWMQEHKPLQEMAYDNLLALKKRHYFNNQFLDNLIHLHKEGHAAYYGELIWILTVFELWISQSLPLHQKKS